jgi:hypothetical protein
MSAERALQFQKRAAECHLKASKATTEQMRRAWLIAARDWEKMAEREQAKTKAETAPV